MVTTKTKPQATPHKAGWRVNEWAADVGVSRALVYELLAEGRLNSVKLGAARLITTTPKEFVTALIEAKAA